MSSGRSTPRTVLLAHNRYQQPGGEDVGYAQNVDLLETRGHRVVRYERSNDEIAGYGLLDRARLAAGTTWSISTARALGDVLRRERPDVAHFINTFPLISPSAFAACHRAGVPVVLTVPNFRLTCSNAYLYRDGHICEDCLHRRVKWPGVVHGCYHDSRAESAVVASMLTIHGILGTWTRHVDALLAVSGAVRDVLLEAGLPPEVVHVRHHFVSVDPGTRPAGAGDFALYVGRLSPEKGLDVLLDAARGVPELPVRIAGDGPERARLEQRVASERLEHVTLLGHQDRAAVTRLMLTARALVVPSQWYEAFGHVVDEAFACGLPVIASDLGALPELVDATVGRVFRASDPGDLAAHLRWAASAQAEVEALGHAARRRYEERFSPAPAYERLMDLYDLAADRFSRRSGGSQRRSRS
jgi:glycosyltransferase involved in cell wall biosynthesis